MRNLGGRGEHAQALTLGLAHLPEAERLHAEVPRDLLLGEALARLLSYICDALLRERRAQEAIPHLGRLLVVAGPDHEVAARLAWCLHRTGAFDEAVARQREAIAALPADAEAELRASYQRRLDEYGRAGRADEPR